MIDVTRYIYFYFLGTQHVSGINMSIFGSLRLCCWTATLAVLFCNNLRYTYTAPTNTSSTSYYISNNVPHHTQENGTSNTQKVTVVKTNRHTLLAATKRQNISHLTHTTKQPKFTLTLTPLSLQNNTANVVVQQHSRTLLKMDILIPETCWVSKK